MHTWTAKGRNRSSCVYNAPINVKPGWGGSCNPREFDCGVYPQGGDFDRTSCIWSFNFILFLLILTILFHPGVGILKIFFRKCQNPHPIPDPPPLGLDTDRCIPCGHSFTRICRLSQIFLQLIFFSQNVTCFFSSNSKLHNSRTWMVAVRRIATLILSSFGSRVRSCKVVLYT